MVVITKPLVSLILVSIWGAFFITIVYGYGSKPTRGLHEMVTDEIIPDIIDHVPRRVLDVRYNEVTVKFGNVLTPYQVKDKPFIQWEANPKKLYLLCMVDPDVPSRQDRSRGEVQHYLVGNIPGSDVFKGEVLTEYFGSGPRKGSGKHRYVFLVYEQPGRLTFDEKRITSQFDSAIFGFSIRNFAKKYRLGQPIAGNFFKAEWDYYVNIAWGLL